MLVDFFDKAYTSIKDKNALLSKLRFYSALRFGVRSLANAVLPVYFRWTRHNPAYSLPEVDKPQGRVIVSLTSFPARIGKVWLVVETLLRQSKKPDMIILWLSKEQFPTKKVLPRKLLDLQGRGLRIELREGDLRSHKKYYYTLTEYPDDILVTVDDDVFYSPFMLERLWKTHLRFPHAVCCNHSHLLSYEASALLPYVEWKHNESMNEVPRSDLLPVGIGGVLYPVGFGYAGMLKPTAFMEVCRNADDIWLKAMGNMLDIPAVQTSYHSLFLPVQNKNNKTLSSVNLDFGNDVQIEAVRKYCVEHFGKDPFACRG